MRKSAVHVRVICNIQSSCLYWEIYWKANDGGSGYNTQKRKIGTVVELSRNVWRPEEIDTGIYALPRVEANQIEYKSESTRLSHHLNPTPDPKQIKYHGGSQRRDLYILQFRWSIINIQWKIPSQNQRYSKAHLLGWVLIAHQQMCLYHIWRWKIYNKGGHQMQSHWIIRRGKAQ